MSDADWLRREMGQQRSDRIRPALNQFTVVAHGNGYSEGAAKYLLDYWFWVELDFAFGKAHCIDRAPTTYWASYLKCHFRMNIA